ncbi:hypothetical protein [Pseudonocardia sp. T1-2H]|uniref:hypothetical protein n=1 Tax=Pseudonocardia sp. T1-2H TaxID=3128899 RepID=UPI003100E2DE
MASRAPRTWRPEIRAGLHAGARDRRTSPTAWASVLAVAAEREGLTGEDPVRADRPVDDPGPGD